MPFGKKRVLGTDAMFDFDKTYRVVMQPAIRLAGLEPVRADESASSGLIHGEMFAELRDRPVVLADLSLHNPNVFYELGVRHVMAQRGTVLMCEESTHLPFDIAVSRVIKYRYDGTAFDFEEAERVKPLLTAALRDATSQPDSPVHANLDRVLQESTAEVEFGLDRRVAHAESNEVLRRYARTIAKTWRKGQSIDGLLKEHGGSRLGVLALAEFCLGARTLTKGAERVASRLRIYDQNRLAAELFKRVDREGRLSTWRYMQWGAAIKESDPNPATAKEALAIQKKALDRARSDFKKKRTEERRWDYAYCLYHIGAMHEWIWRLSGREDDTQLAAAIDHYTESTTTLGDTVPPWLNFVVLARLKLLYLLRARDGRTDRTHEDSHLKAILATSAPVDSASDVKSAVGWYKVIVYVERGSADSSRREAFGQLERDTRLASTDPSFDRLQLYSQIRRFMRDNTDYQRSPRLWDTVAQLLKAASVPQAEEA